MLLSDRDYAIGVARTPKGSVSAASRIKIIINYDGQAHVHIR